MQYELFSDADFQQETPFTGRSVCLLGGVPKSLQQKIYVVLGPKVSPDDLGRVEQLAYNGYKPKVLDEHDLEEILQGHYKPYLVPEQITKDLHLTHQHYLASRMSYEGAMNPLYTKELYLAPDIPTDFYQMLGNRGIYANTYIDDTTDVIVISNNSLQRLQEGQTDDNLRYIEQQYNQSRAQAFRYVMTSEGELLAWLNRG